MRGTQILLVDDDASIRRTLAAVLEGHGFEVTVAATAPEALEVIDRNRYDLLLIDLREAGNDANQTMASAMRRAQPRAVTMVLRAFPEMDALARAIMHGADRAAPADVARIVAAIGERLALASRPERVIESVATILEKSIDSTVEAWLKRVESNERLAVIAMTREQRAAHLPQVMHDLIGRLRFSFSLGNKELLSIPAEEHGRLRCKQGYTAAMLVEESRMLQVSIFETLQNNMAAIDFGFLLNGVMTIADEVDSQLSQAMDAFIDEALGEVKSA